MLKPGKGVAFRPLRRTGGTALWACAGAKFTANTKMKVLVIWLDTRSGWVTDATTDTCTFPCHHNAHSEQSKTTRYPLSSEAPPAMEPH